MILSDNSLMSDRPGRNSEEIPLNASKPLTPEELLAIFICCNFRLQDEISGTGGEVGMRFDPWLPTSATKPSLVNHFSLSRRRVVLRDPKTLEQRIADV